MRYKSDELKIEIDIINDKYDERKIMISFINYQDHNVFVQKLWDHEAQFIINALREALEKSKEV